MSSDPTSIPSKNTESNQTKQEKRSPFRFNANAQPFEPTRNNNSGHFPSKHPATNGNYSEKYTRNPMNYTNFAPMVYVHQHMVQWSEVDATPHYQSYMQPGIHQNGYYQNSTQHAAPLSAASVEQHPSQFQSNYYQPMVQNPMPYGSQAFSYQYSGFQSAGSINMVPPHLSGMQSADSLTSMNALQPQPKQSQLPMHGYSGESSEYQQERVDDKYSIPPTTHAQQFGSLPQSHPKISASTIGYSAVATPDSEQPSEVQAISSSTDLPQSKSQCNNLMLKETVTEDVSRNPTKRDYEKIKEELESLKKRYSAVESWAKSNNIDLDSVLANFERRKEPSEITLSSSIHSSNVRNDVVTYSSEVIVVKKDEGQARRSESTSEAQKRVIESIEEECFSAPTPPQRTTSPIRNVLDVLLIPRPLQSTYQKPTLHMNPQNVTLRKVEPEVAGNVHTNKESIAKSQQHPAEAATKSVTMHRFFKDVGIKLNQPTAKEPNAPSATEEGGAVDEIQKQDAGSDESRLVPSSLEKPVIPSKEDTGPGSSAEEVTSGKAVETQVEESDGDPKTDDQENVETVKENIKERVEEPDKSYTTEDHENVQPIKDDPIEMKKKNQADTILCSTNAEKITAFDVPKAPPVHNDCQETSNAREMSKEPLTKVFKQIENYKEKLPIREKKVIDYSKWVDRDKVHKRWAAEVISITEDAKEKDIKNIPTDLPVPEPQLIETNENTVVEPPASHKKSLTLVPPEETEEEFDSVEVKEEEELKTLLRSQNIVDQGDTLEEWLFDKAKKELLQKKPPAVGNAKLLDKNSLEGVIAHYVDLFDDYSDVMYNNRASYLAFKREREEVHPFQELMITHWRHNPLYAHRVKRAASGIDTIVRRRMRFYKDLGTLFGQHMYCFLAILVFLDRECLTADLLFLYGIPKSESLLRDHEEKYFEMVLTFKDWQPPQYLPKPVYSEDMELVPVKIYVGDMVNFLRLINLQCYRRIQCTEREVEMDRAQLLVYNAHMNARKQGIDWSPEKTTKFLRSRLRKLKKIKEPSEQVVEHKTFYEFLLHVSSSILDFDVYWFKECLEPKNKEEWHCLKSDADFFAYLFKTER